MVWGIESFFCQALVRGITVVRGIFQENDACVAIVVVINNVLFDIAFGDELNWGVGVVSFDIHDFSDRE